MKRAEVGAVSSKGVAVLPASTRVLDHLVYTGSDRGLLGRSLAHPQCNEEHPSSMAVCRAFALMPAHLGPLSLPRSGGCFNTGQAIEVLRGIEHGVGAGAGGETRRAGMGRCWQQQRHLLQLKSAKQTPEIRAKPATPHITTSFNSKLSSYTRKIQSTKLSVTCSMRLSWPAYSLPQRNHGFGVGWPCSPGERHLSPEHQRHGRGDTPVHETLNYLQPSPWQVGNQSTGFPSMCANVDDVGQVRLVFITL